MSGDVQRLVVVLRDPDISRYDRQEAARELGDTGAKEAVPALVSIVLDPSTDSAIAEEAGRALSSIDDASVLDRFVEALSHEDWSVRGRAAAALGWIGDTDTVGPRIASVFSPEPLICALEDEDDGVRNRAAKSLGLIGGAAVVDPLIAKLGDTAARDTAWEALYHLWSYVEDGSVTEQDWRVIQAVRKTLAYNQDTPQALEELSALAAEGDTRAVAPLVKALGATSIMDIMFRMAAANGLGAIGDPRTVEPLVEVLRVDERAEVAAAAARALGAIGDPKAVRPLMSALAHLDEHGWVSSSSAEALGRLGKPAIQPLAEVLSEALGVSRGEDGPWGESGTEHHWQACAASAKALSECLSALDENADLSASTVEALRRVLPRFRRSLRFWSRVPSSVKEPLCRAVRQARSLL